MEYILRTNTVSKKYTNYYAVDKVSISIQKGEIYKKLMSLLWWLKKNAYKVGVLTIFLYNLFVIYNRKCFQ